MERIENAYKARIEDAVAATRAAVEEGIGTGGGVVVEKVGDCFFSNSSFNECSFCGLLIHSLLVPSI